MYLKVIYKEYIYCFTGSKTKYFTAGIDNTVETKSCDLEKIKKAKIKSLLHRAVDDNKATGKQLILKLMSTKVQVISERNLGLINFQKNEK